MKTKNYLLSLLSLPYLAWVIAAIISLILVWPLLYTVGFLITYLAEFIPILNDLLYFYSVIYFLMLVYVFAIVLWGVPYTFFAISFLFWSKNKSIKSMYSVLFYSPFLLAAMSVVELSIVGLISSLLSWKMPSLEDWKSFGLISLLGITLCLLYGYFFVGTGMAGYKLLDILKLFKNESEAPQTSTLLETTSSSDTN